ncbi:MAG: beta-ketoacyl-ACP synthase II [Bacteroidales bacterium]|nr:beta-ketoacyl-ACP synthase II [Bacteroidales bacterium]
MQRRRVVVTGMGAVTPIGNDVAAFWDGLRHGVSGANLITRFDATNFKTRFACEVKNLDTSSIFDRKEIRKYDLYTQFSLIAAEEAVQQSGIISSYTDLNKVGVIFASGIGGLISFTSEIKDFALGDGHPRFSPFFIPKVINSMAAGQISMKFGFKGPCFATASACASASNAIIDACIHIQSGKADAFLAGGGDATVSEPGIGGFNSMQALSTDNENYSQACRPFDLHRNGFVMGEGAGALVLEEYEHAVRRGATIYAEIAGVGMSADAYHFTAPHPEGEGAARSMQNALDDAGVMPAQIEYINAHGTATPLGDLAEAKAIVHVFGDHASHLNISSTKSMTGHLLGGSGAIEAIASILALRHGIVPPTINHSEDDPEMPAGLNFTFNKAQKRDMHYVMSNNFGFGGQNATIIFKKTE